MKPTELIEMLECEWENLETGLGQNWGSTHHEMQSVIDALPADPNEHQMEEAAATIEMLLRKHEYSRGVLDGWCCAQETATVERRPGSSSQTLSSEEKVKSLCNRLRRLAR